MNSVNLFDLISSNKIEYLYLSGAKFDPWEAGYLATAIANKWRNTLIEIDLSWSSLSAENLKMILDSFSDTTNSTQSVTLAMKRDHGNINSKLRGINMSGTCVQTDIIKYVPYTILNDILYCKSCDFFASRCCSRSPDFSKNCNFYSTYTVNPC